MICTERRFNGGKNSKKIILMRKRMTLEELFSFSMLNGIGSEKRSFVIFFLENET